MANLIRGAVLEMLEGEEDIREGSKAAQQREEDYITLEEYEKLGTEEKEGTRQGYSYRLLHRRSQ